MSQKERMRKPTIEDILTLATVVPVVTLEDEGVGSEVAHALLRGGVPLMEVTLRTPAALAVIRRIARDVPQMKVSAGTIRSHADMQAATDAGATFIVSPGATAELLRAGALSAVPYLPGVASASELMVAMDAGYEYVKLFPATSAGGIEMLRALEKPFPNARFCPTGGITAATAPHYLRLPNVCCVGGSWLTPERALAARDWGQIEKLAGETLNARRTSH
jgi:2-dehydro-3-deoxyphosphogluconate aldolase/(4S)-4-hydroxy-2-oxoglutarate aldolase